jgi:hypothetical protein
MEFSAAAHDGSEWRVISHARVDQNNNVTLDDGALIASPLALRRPPPQLIRKGLNASPPMPQLQARS